MTLSQIAAVPRVVVVILRVLSKGKPGVFILLLACAYAINALAVLLQLPLQLHQVSN